jgi:hypothetical protein
MIAAVNSSFVWSTEEPVPGSEASERDVTTAEDVIDVVSTNNSVVA